MATERRREVRYPARLTARIGRGTQASLERLADAESRPVGDVVREVLDVGGPIVAKRVEARVRRAGRVRRADRAP